MIPLKTRVKDDKWYEDIAEYYMPAYNEMFRDDYDDKKALYEIINNDISHYKDRINAMCNNAISLGANLDEDILPYNKIKSKLNVLEGDLISRSTNHKIVLLSAKLIRDKNERLYNAIKESINTKLQTILEEAQMKQMSEKELQQFIKQAEEDLLPTDINYKNFLTEHEIFSEKLLKYSFFDQDVIGKKLDTFRDCAIAGEMYAYNGWKHGKPHIIVCNPLHIGFDKSPDTKYIQKGSYVYYTDEIKIVDAINDYHNVLNDEDYDKLLKYSGFQNMPDTMSKRVFGHEKYYATLAAMGNDSIKNRGVGLHQGDFTNVYTHKDSLYRTHLEFLAYDEVIFYTYTDEYNEKVMIQLDGKADIVPENAKKVKYINKYHQEDFKHVWEENGITHEVMVKWIPQRYEIERIGYDIYTKKRKVPYQPQYSDPYNQFELSYKGGIVYSRNARSISLVEQALPIQFQIFAIKALENKEIASYEGTILTQDVDQIPIDLAGEDDDNGKRDLITNNTVIRKKTKTAFYSGSQSSHGLPVPSTRTQGIGAIQIGTIGEVLNMQQLIQALDTELGVTMGIPPQREAQVMPGTNVRDNQQSLVQSTLATEHLFFWHNKLWSIILNEHVNNLKTYYRNIFVDSPAKKDHVLEFTSIDGTKELLRITPEYVRNEDIGIYMNDSNNDKLYMDYLLMNLQPIAQNAGDGAIVLSQILKSIATGASVSEIDKMITDLAEKQNKKAQQMQQSEQEAQQKMEEMRRDAEKFNKQLDIYQDNMKEQNRRQTEIMKINEKGMVERDIELKKLEIKERENELYEMQLNMAEGNNNEQERLRLEYDIKQKDLQLKETDQLLKNKDIEVKKEIGMRKTRE